MIFFSSFLKYNLSGDISHFRNEAFIQQYRRATLYIVFCAPLSSMVNVFASLGSRGRSCAWYDYSEEILTVSWVKLPERELRRMPGTAGEGGRLSSGVLAGGVGILMMAAVKSLSSQFSFRSSLRALRLERLLTHTESLQ